MTTLSAEERARLRRMNDVETIAYCGNDAKKWTDAFDARFSGERIDYGTMLGWFANAIETASAEQIRQAEQAARHQGVEQAREEFQEILEVERKAARADERRNMIDECADFLPTYDAGLLPEPQGATDEWWQDVMRAELGRAYEFYVSAIRALDKPESEG